MLDVPGADAEHHRSCTESAGRTIIGKGGRTARGSLSSPSHTDHPSKPVSFSRRQTEQKEPGLPSAAFVSSSFHTCPKWAHSWPDASRDSRVRARISVSRSSIVLIGMGAVKS